MSLIDSSYFIGPLTIAQLGQPAVVSNLNLFINRAEPRFLEAVLGYALYQDFVAGLSQTVVDQKWIDLRDGCDFVTVSNWPGWYWGLNWFNRYYWLRSQRPTHWAGFASSTTYTANASLGPQLNLIAGSGLNNPVVGAKSFTLAALAGATYSIERRGFGTLIEGVDYALSHNKQTITLLKLGDVFGPDEIFILKFTQQVQAGIPSSSYVSPIAGFVYYEWVRDQATMNTGSGVVKSTPENATNAFPGWRMADAWNQMAKDVFILWQFLESRGTDVYENYDITLIDYSYCRPINTMNI